MKKSITTEWPPILIITIEYLSWLYIDKKINRGEQGCDSRLKKRE